MKFFIRSSFVGFTAALVPVLARAATVFKIENPLGAPDFQTVIVRIADFLAAIAIPLTTLMVIFAAYLYLTGGENPDQIKRAHKAIIWAVVGLIVVLVAKGLSELIQSVLGVK